jgi:mRNA-degrading endonuclease YafQ of YafQ-DinJ toxin-antitoxin module
MAANYIVLYSKKFRSAFEKLTDAERELVMDKIELLEDDPFYPSLRSKKFHGRTVYYECSVNMDIRILWQYENGRIILLLNIGHHDILKKKKRRR